MHAPDAPSAAGESARRCQVGPDLSLAHMSVTYGAPVGVDRYICGGRQKELSAFILVMGEPLLLLEFIFLIIFSVALFLFLKKISSTSYVLLYKPYLLTMQPFP